MVVGGRGTQRFGSRSVAPEPCQAPGACMSWGRLQDEARRAAYPNSKPVRHACVASGTPTFRGRPQAMELHEEGGLPRPSLGGGIIARMVRSWLYWMTVGKGADSLADVRAARVYWR